MAASYPSSIVVLATKVDAVDTYLAAHINALQDETIAVETALLNGLQHTLLPLTDDTYSLGSTTKRWLKGWYQDLDLDGTLTLVAGLTVANGGTGGVTLTNHGVLLGQGTSAVVATSAGTTGYPLVSNGASADPTFQAPVLTLLKQGSGTSTAAGATTVDSIAITGLTAKDTLLVYYEVESVTADTALTGLYDVTDSVALANFVAGAVVTAGASFIGTATISQRQGGGTLAISQARGMNTVTNAAADDGRRTTFTTVWTGAWTLGLRHNGVTATGTFSYVWAVYKLAGQ